MYMCNSIVLWLSKGHPGLNASVRFWPEILLQEHMFQEQLLQEHAFGV